MTHKLAWLGNVTTTDVEPDMSNETNKKLADGIRFIADKLDDEDIADELHTIADEVEVDRPRLSAKGIPPDGIVETTYRKKMNEMSRAISSLVDQLGWIIDDEELPNNDYDAPRKKTRMSRNLRRIILDTVPASDLPICTPWLQDERKYKNE